MLFDDIYEYVGHVGVYQLCLVAIACSLSMFDSEPITMVYVGGQMDHWCRIEELTNRSYEEQKLLAIPIDTDGVYSSCTMYDYNYTLLLLLNSTNGNDVTMAANNADIIACKEWVYDRSMFSSTIVSKFNLVCNKAILNQLVSTLYMLGGLAGAISSGAISDRLARHFIRSKPAVLLAHIASFHELLGSLHCLCLAPVPFMGHTVFGVAEDPKITQRPPPYIGRKRAIQGYFCLRLISAAIVTFAINYPMFIVGRFLLGVGGNGCRVIGYVLIMEIVGPKYRAACSCAIQISLSCGIVICSVMAIALRDEYTYQLAFFSPLLVYTLYTFFLIPESPKWLFAREKYDELNKVLIQIAAVNDQKLPDGLDSRNFEKTKKQNKKHRLGCTALLKTPRMRFQSIILSFSWFVCSMVYYALLLNVSTLPGNLYVNTCISGVLEIPGLLIGALAARSQRLGRRATSAGSMILTGVANFICIPLIIYGLDTATTVFSLLGKVTLMTFCGVIMVYTSELYPTEVRNIAIGAGLMSSRVGSTISPYMGSNLVTIWKPLPSVIIGIIATVSGSLIFLLPETRGQPLCDTIEQQEEMNRKLKRPAASIDLTIEFNELSAAGKDTFTPDTIISSNTSVNKNGIINKSFINEDLNNNLIIVINNSEKSKTNQNETDINTKAILDVNGVVQPVSYR